MERNLPRHDKDLASHAVYMTALGRLIRNHRVQSNLTLVDAAEQMGVSKSALSI